MLKRGFIGVFFVLLTLAGYCQTNLVPNPSFEMHDTCPNAFSQIRYALSWAQPTTGNPDYCNSCCVSANPNNMGVPSNEWGFQNAHTGVGYADFTLFNYGGTTYREYIQAKLTATLTAGQKYYVTAYVSLADSCNYAIDGMGLYFSQTAITRSDYYAFGYLPQITNSSGNILSDKTNWMKISGTFIAIGNEQYVTIGNFKNDSTTDTVRVTPNLSTGAGGIYQSATYYVDDICVSTDSITCNNTIGINRIANDNDLFYYDSRNKRIVVNENGLYVIKIIDAYGNPKAEMFLHGNHNIDVSNYEMGCYIILLNEQNNSYYKKVIINN